MPTCFRPNRAVLAAVVALFFSQSAGAQTYDAGDPCSASAACPSSCQAPQSAYSVVPQTYAAPPVQRAASPAYATANGQFYPSYVAPAGQMAYRPLLPLYGQQPNVEVGRGLLGQPTAFVPGQPVRNLLRYITPF